MTMRIFTTSLLLFILYRFLLSPGVSSADNTPQVANENRAGGRGEQVLVILEKTNDYADTFEHGQFTRAGNSGAGTGPFIGRGFEFSKGACESSDAGPDTKRRWRAHTLGCSRQLLEADWCARRISDPSIQYTLYFLSWTIGPEGPSRHCQGRCDATGNRTAYIRTRVK